MLTLRQLQIVFSVADAAFELALDLGPENRPLELGLGLHCSRPGLSERFESLRNRLFALISKQMLANQLLVFILVFCVEESAHFDDDFLIELGSDQLFQMSQVFDECV